MKRNIDFNKPHIYKFYYIGIDGGYFSVIDEGINSMEIYDAKYDKFYTFNEYLKTWDQVTYTIVNNRNLESIINRFKADYKMKEREKIIKTLIND